MAGPEIIQTQRLLGKPVRESDLPYVVSIDTDEQVQKTLFGVTFTYDESKARLGRWLQHWNEHGFGFWIFRDGENEVVGHAGLFHSPRVAGSIEVGYALPPKYWNKGYASEMTMAVLRVGFDVLQLSRIVAIAQPANAASRRVMEKCGLIFEDEYEAAGGPSVLYAIELDRWRSFTAAHMP